MARKTSQNAKGKKSNGKNPQIKKKDSAKHARAQRNKPTLENQAKWERKKNARTSKKRAQLGIPTDCTMQSWEQPPNDRCSSCSLKCSFNNSNQ